MSKFVLNLEDQYEFTLIGISCHKKDYRLCWELNKSLNIDLVREEDLTVVDNKEELSFTFYRYLNREEYLDYYLIGNRSNNAILIPEQKMIDFWLKIEGDIYEEQKTTILNNLKGLPVVLTAFEINPESLKSKQNLLF